MNKPNIILILADDMGFGDFGVFGNGSAHTPNLDALIRDGLCLTEHYSASPVCAPARAALLTGRYSHRTGVIDTLEACGLDRLALRERTIADVLKLNSYKTGLIGKWHCGALDRRYHPKNRGFDTFTGLQGGWMNYYNWTIEENGMARTGKGEYLEGGDDYHGWITGNNGKPRRGRGEYLTDFLTEKALEYIDKYRKDNFFLHLAYTAPHFPIEAPEEDISFFRNKGNLNEKQAVFYAMLKKMDEGIGKILNKLKSCDLEEETIVIFTSDNGPALTGLIGVDRYNCELRGEKKYVYEGGLKVPAVIRWPGKISANTKSDAFIHFTDWFPTLLEAAGIDSGEYSNLDGNNVLETLMGKKSNEAFDRFWQFNNYEPVPRCNAAVRSGDWKLVYPPIDEAMKTEENHLMMDIIMKEKPGQITDIQPVDIKRNIPEHHPAELYNLKDDPGEKCDLALSNTKKKDELIIKLDCWFDSVEKERGTITD